MYPAQHVLASGALGAVVYLISRDPKDSIASFLAGWLVDADHLLDWLKLYGLSTDLRSVYGRFSRCQVPRAYVVLHSWELVMAFGAICIFYSFDSLLVCILLGWLFHLLLDELHNRPKKILSYFFIYRLIHNFDTAFLGTLRS